MNEIFGFNPFMVTGEAMATWKKLGPIDLEHIHFKPTNPLGIIKNITIPLNHPKMLVPEVEDGEENIFYKLTNPGKVIFEGQIKNTG